MKTASIVLPLAAQSRLVANVRVLSEWIDSTRMDSQQRSRMLLVVRGAALFGLISSAIH